MTLRRIVLCAALALRGAAAQDSRAAIEESLRRQQMSVERQRAAVRGQVRSAAPHESSFFTSPWTTPPPVAPGAVLPCEPVPPAQIGPMVEEISKREGLSPDLLRAVIEKESAYLPCAVSQKGAQGLMQLMPGTAALLGVDDPFDPRQNLDGGAKFLKQLLDRYGGNLGLALAAYNAGPARVDAAGGLPIIPETIDYVSGILGKLRAEDRK